MTKPQIIGISVIAIISALLGSILGPPLSQKLLKIRKGSDMDQPVTMAGGSLKMRSGEWTLDVGSSPPTYQYAGTRVARVEWACNYGDTAPAESTVVSATEIQIRYQTSNPFELFDFNTVKFHIDADGRNLRVQVLKRDTSNSVDLRLLRAFIEVGDHPRDWTVVHLRSSGLSSNFDCSTTGDFFLKIHFGP